MEIKDIELFRIEVPPNRRPTKPASVLSLADSILKVGLLQPIGLTEDLHLVYGRHRLDAYIALGASSIPAVILKVDSMQAELAEIDENLKRTNLSAIMEAKALKRRKQIYLTLFPETKHGAMGGKGNNKKASNNETENISVSFAEDTAAKTGKTARAIRGDVALADAIPDDVANLTAETPVADNKRELKKLANMPEEEQRVVAEKIAAGAKTVNEAVTGKRRASPAKPKPKAKGKPKAAQAEPYVEAASDNGEVEAADFDNDQDGEEFKEGDEIEARLRECASDAMLFAGVAISQLDRIPDSDPLRVKAFNQVALWIQEKMKKMRYLDSSALSAVK